MGPIEQEFKKWQEWAELINADLSTQMLHWHIYDNLITILKNNRHHVIDNSGKEFFLFVQDSYVSHVLVGIRRQVKVKDISLMRLLDQIHKLAHRFTYQFYLDRFQPASYWQEVTFAPFTDDGKVVSQTIIAADMCQLTDLSNEITTWVDKRIAHIDKDNVDHIIITLGDIRQCMTVLDQLTCKYLKLVMGAGPCTLIPTIIEDWQQIFRVPIDKINADHSS